MVQARCHARSRLCYYSQYGSNLSTAGNILNDSEISNGEDQDQTPFRVWRESSGFWSNFGYDGLSIVFDVPLEDIHVLAEAKKMALFRLMCYLADTPGDPLQEQVRVLATRPADQRLAVLLDLSARFGE